MIDVFDPIILRETPYKEGVPNTFRSRVWCAGPLLVPCVAFDSAMRFRLQISTGIPGKEFEKAKWMRSYNLKCMLYKPLPSVSREGFAVALS